MLVTYASGALTVAPVKAGRDQIRQPSVLELGVALHGSEALVGQPSHLHQADAHDGSFRVVPQIQPVHKTSTDGLTFLSVPHSSHPEESGTAVTWKKPLCTSGLRNRIEANRAFTEALESDFVRNVGAHQDGTFDTELRTHKSKPSGVVHALDERYGLGTSQQGGLDLTAETLDQLMRRNKDQQRCICHCLRQTWHGLQVVPEPHSSNTLDIFLTLVALCDHNSTVRPINRVRFQHKRLH